MKMPEIREMLFVGPDPKPFLQRSSWQIEKFVELTIQSTNEFILTIRTHKFGRRVYLGSHLAQFSKLEIGEKLKPREDHQTSMHLLNTCARHCTKCLLY